MCHLIISNIEIKNPKATYGMTSFHIAAENDIVYLHRVFFQISSKSNMKSKVSMICRSCCKRYASDNVPTRGSQIRSGKASECSSFFLQIRTAERGGGMRPLVISRKEIYVRTFNKVVLYSLFETTDWKFISGNYGRLVNSRPIVNSLISVIISHEVTL